ncbi:MAG: Crp/Fnr family transcriptional regulator [Mucilaginibacter sp.]
MVNEYQLILDNICRYINLTDEEKQVFIALLTRRSLKRGEFLLTEGMVCRYSAFVLSGCLFGYSVDREANEHIISFAPADWWIADMYSLISQKPGTMNIRAHEASEILLLSRTDQEKLFIAIPKFERFFRILTEKSLVANQQRLIDNLSLTAEERYKNFTLRYPALVHHLPQKQIAAYIGVTPEFFSKMKSRLL